MSDLGDLRTRYRLPAPVFGFAFCEVEFTLWRGARADGDLGRPGGAHFDPFRQGGHLFSRQASLRRHLIQLAVIDRIDEQALLRFSRHDGGASLAPLYCCREGIEPQAPFGLVDLAAVALEAVG